MTAHRVELVWTPQKSKAQQWRAECECGWKGNPQPGEMAARWSADGHRETESRSGDPQCQ